MPGAVLSQSDRVRFVASELMRVEAERERVDIKV